MDDRGVVASQLGREPRAFLRVAARCPWGGPAVTEQDPYAMDGTPFPTTYYLTCPHLVAAVSRLEAVGGVERWSNEVAHDTGLRRDLEQATAEQAHIRARLAGGRTGRDGGASLASGIGGSRNPGELKCLHAHVAFGLAVSGYELGARILAEVVHPWPADACCSAVGSARR